MLIKICGITRLDDARCAVECGARALGFVFWPESPRVIDPSRASTIIATLPPFVTPVGVFVNQPAAYVNEVAVAARLGAVQLHGDETVEYAEQIERPVLKAIAPGAPGAPGANDEAIDQWPSQVLLLLDAHDPVGRGGTGRTIDWPRAAAIARRRPVVLAGGLTPENVADAIECVQPFGVDVSSGVESAPGVKDHARLRRLFEVISEVESTQRTQWTQ